VPFSNPFFPNPFIPNPFFSNPFIGQLLVGFFAQDYGELGFAGFGGIVEGGGFAVALGGAEEESLLGSIGQAGEAGFAIGVGSDFEVELVQAHESVGDVDADVGSIDGRAGGIGHGEIRGARADGSVDYGDGFGVGIGVLGVGEGGEQDQEREYGLGRHIYKITPRVSRRG